MNQIQSLPPQETQQVVAIQAIKQVDAADQRDVLQQKALGAPDRLVTDKIWLLIVASFAFILVGSFLALTAALFFLSPQAPNAVLITVFTAAVSFLSGLLAPSPVSK